ncbi:MAG: helicase C-terminal domain-containing protein, partial [Sphaerochaetaceae bacterium]
PPKERPFFKEVYPSPFDFKHNLLLLTPNDAPLFSEQNSGEYLEYVTQTIYEALQASNGGALVLFTSYKMLEEVANNLRDKLKALSIELLMQGQKERYSLLQEFSRLEDSVLFATDSFWEGVDAPGSTLRMVIIVKLPFRVPTDPVFKARQEALDNEGKSGFFSLALPEATMKLKQGFGRLLRNTVDSGIVLILDSRVVNKQYGKWMLRALPESFHPETTITGIPLKIEAFLYK